MYMEVQRICILALVLTACQVLAVGGLQGASMRRGCGCIMPDTAGSSHFQQPHYRGTAKLSSHEYVVNACRKTDLRKDNTVLERGKGLRNVKNSSTEVRE